MRKWLIPVLSLAALTACGETTGQRATTGAVGGGAAGAVVGGPVGAVAGAGIGAVAGANRDKVDSGTDKATDAAREKVAEATDRSGQQATTARSADRISGPGPTNEEVKEAQIVLQEMGLYDGKVDGIYGRKTVAAVGKFQEQNDLPRTRTLNEPTQQKLQQQASATGNKNRDQGSSQDSQTPPAQPKAREGTSPAPQQTQ